MGSAIVLTTTEAARLARVTASTVKRWADQRILGFSKTAGGHRRFERGAVERLLRHQAAGSKAGEDPLLDRWMRGLIDARRHEVDSLLLEARSRLGSWCAVCDEVALALSEMGRQWRQGQVTIAQEHVASDCLSRALSRISDALPMRQDGPRCALACATGDEHTTGLAMAELGLREFGWTSVWLGRHTPLAEVVRLIRKGDVELVALSASAAQHDHAALREFADQIGRAGRAGGVGVVLGGAGAWPIAPAHAIRMNSFAEFGEFLSRHNVIGTSSRQSTSMGVREAPVKPRR